MFIKKYALYAIENATTEHDKWKLFLFINQPITIKTNNIFETNNTIR